MRTTAVEREIVRQAEAFWRQAGLVEDFPRALERPVLWALPLAIVKLPRLGLDSLRQWLRRRQISVYPGVRDRPLRGCLVARGGQGFVFVDGCDPDDERRLSLGHEVAHFIRDYLRPRHKAIQALGEEIIEVLDGRRAPTPEEQLAGVFKRVHVGVFTHLLERNAAGNVDRIDILVAEDAADRLALELLAPKEQVLRRVGLKTEPSGQPQQVATRVLVRDFGLPPSAAKRYANFLVNGQTPPRSFREWLGENEESNPVELSRAIGKRGADGRPT